MQVVRAVLIAWAVMFAVGAVLLVQAAVRDRRWRRRTAGLCPVCERPVEELHVHDRAGVCVWPTGDPRTVLVTELDGTRAMAVMA